MCEYQPRPVFERHVHLLKIAVVSGNYACFYIRRMPADSHVMEWKQMAMSLDLIIFLYVPAACRLNLNHRR
ncbi:hypothetical protein EDD85DRAFT_857593 [Armillaria nabsnona]|nr:hypothetical protein EDD85DRAFT_857593 [Armillaria nabsnona]